MYLWTPAEVAERKKIAALVFDALSALTHQPAYRSESDTSPEAQFERRAAVYADRAINALNVLVWLGDEQEEEKG